MKPQVLEVYMIINKKCKSRGGILCYKNLNLIKEAIIKGEIRLTDKKMEARRLMLREIIPTKIKR